MSSTGRREFLSTGALVAGTFLSRMATANPLELPLGLQPYTVRNDLTNDFTGTLKRIKAMGYEEIELSYGPGYGAFYGYPPGDLKRILTDFALKAPSCHYRPPADDSVWAANIETSQVLGVEYMLCSTPPKESQSTEGWKRTSDLFNHLGEACRKGGMQFGYHNHNSEFRLFDGVRGYDLLLRETDKNLVKMQMDCFWATFAGVDPVEYFAEHPGRFPMLHIKDLKPGYAPNTGHFDGNPFTEVGKGIIDWKRIFAAAPKAGVKHYFVEQDLWDGPSLESARISAEFLKKLRT